jgi:zinc/manganese transport system substrate-binding protein
MRKKLIIHIQAIIVSLLLLFLETPTFALIKIITAENNYGVIAKMIAGDKATVINIMQNTNIDPHLFSVDPNTVRLITTSSEKDIFIINGADYDSWALSLASNSRIHLIDVAKINHVKPGANPHLWYNLNYVNQLAIVLTKQLIDNQPNDKKFFENNLATFLLQTKKIQQEITTLRMQYQNIKIAGTEPIADYLTEALGLVMLDHRFQLSVMNDTEPSPTEVATITRDLTTHQAKMLIYNKQVTDPTTTAVLDTAKRAGVPVVGVYELLHHNETNFITWYQKTLDNITTALR